MVTVCKPKLLTAIRSSGAVWLFIGDIRTSKAVNRKCLVDYVFVGD